MKINGNEIRPGNVISHKDSLWVAVKRSHVKPGKGGAFAQIELKNLLDGTKLNERFRAGESVERIRLEQRSYQYLYENDGKLCFMDDENYEQIELPKDFVGERAQFLQEGMLVKVESHEGKHIGIKLPEHVTLTIQETAPSVKGQTAANSSKPAILENGIRILIPPFLEVGEKIIINTEDISYVKRAE